MFFIGQNLSFLPYVFLLVTYLAGLSTVSFNLFYVNTSESDQTIEIQESLIGFDTKVLTIDEDDVKNKTYFVFSEIENQDYLQRISVYPLLFEFNLNNYNCYISNYYNSNICTRPPPTIPII